MNDPVMHNLMVGMFWGGVVMALPPVAMTVAVAVYVYRRHRASREEQAERTTAGD